MSARLPSLLPPDPRDLEECRQAFVVKQWSVRTAIGMGAVGVVVNLLGGVGTAAYFGASRSAALLGAGALMLLPISGMFGAYVWSKQDDFEAHSALLEALERKPYRRWWGLVAWPLILLSGGVFQLVRYAPEMVPLCLLACALASALLGSERRRLWMRALTSCTFAVFAGLTWTVPADFVMVRLLMCLLAVVVVPGGVATIAVADRIVDWTQSGGPRARFARSVMGFLSVWHHVELKRRDGDLEGATALTLEMLDSMGCAPAIWRPLEELRRLLPNEDPRALWVAVTAARVYPSKPEPFEWLAESVEDASLATAYQEFAAANAARTLRGR